MAAPKHVETAENKARKNNTAYKKLRKMIILREVHLINIATV